jgi:ABC-type transport system involved in cytochrome c biogenesis permease subunit
MSAVLRRLRDLLVSLKLTVVLLVLGIVLVFWATLAQADLGVWGVHERFFHSFVVTAKFPGTSLYLPIFPGGYVIGGLLLANLVAAHFSRFRWSLRQSGIWLTHLGLILLLVGELLSGLLQEDYDLTVDNGGTRNYTESERRNEIAITDATDPGHDDVVVIPEEIVAQGGSIQHPRLPFKVLLRGYYPNAALQMRRDAPGAPPSPVTMGTGVQVVATQVPETSKEDERNMPAAFVELVAPEGSLGTWLVSPELGMPQHFQYAGRDWKISMRSQRRYLPFSITLLKFSHDVYPGTDIPRNFSSRVRVNEPDGSSREVLIYMNNPLRTGGLTFYQKSFMNEDRTSILQVVRNPSWLMPYIACAMMTLGLVIQFSLHLSRFFRRPRRVAAGAPAAPRESLGSLDRILVAAAVACGAWFLASKLIPPRNPGAFDVTGFGRLPVLANGRVKPFDTIARSSILQLQGRQRVALAGGKSLTPDEWLLNVLFNPEKADSFEIFLIDNPDVLSLIGKTEDDLAIHYADKAHQVMAVLDVPGVPSHRRRFSFREIGPYLDAIEAQAKLADPVDSRVRTPFQQAVLQLYENLSLYERLEHTLQAPGSADFLGELRRFQEALPAGVEAVRAKESGKAHDEQLAKAMMELGKRYDALAQSTNIMAIPPDPGSDSWRSAGQAILEAFGTGQVNPSVIAYAGLGHAWRAGQAEQFNTIVDLYHRAISGRLDAGLRKTNAEVRFNAAEPFYASLVLYIFAFLLAIVSWLVRPRGMGRAAYWLLVLAWAAATVGIAARMWIEGRPPVTNLYSSALFIGWGAVALCVVLETVYRNGIGTVAAGLIGFGTLLIAHMLSLSGDTMEMMRAVLDSNFWLATHVVVVTTGYASTFLAGFLALIYVILGVATPWLHRSFTREGTETNADAIARMVYGIACFATLFSFAGTVLGGIWADQSWGRFWGWDPKENGALIIVIWNAVILHARWGGMIRQRGLMCLAIFGNIVTSWSWFGVNMLGVGLHSYGFTAAAFQALSVFIATQLMLIALGNLPLARWRSQPVAS